MLLLYEPMEKEDVIFAEENGVLKKTGGYYVYYDKNKSMQEYMVRKNEGKSVEKEEKSQTEQLKVFGRYRRRRRVGRRKKRGRNGRQEIPVLFMRRVRFWL